ncbi:hypothetical protein GCM10007049_38410 [Echinicola pacifica]|uniref:VWFA domain-containing protein n=1 Tax=Echinicola pacifica TaxID=346377 RepID=A0A918QDK0_9BACT|nr:VWA domain-containing protein [Echinicola pacifica]GGZ41442.1 hypothetical protein GCM10007049_38410 [Echinicola pacifica]
MDKPLFGINWSEFHFLRPEYLWLFLPMFLLFGLSLFFFQDQNKWKKFIAPALRPYVIRKGSNTQRIVMLSLFVLGFSFGLMALSGPAWEKEELPEKSLETSAVICLEISPSMMATDIQPSRLDRAKLKIEDFINSNPRARLGLVVYGGTAHVVVPLTRDYSIISSHIKSLSTNIMPVQGADMKAGLQLANQMIEGTDAPGSILLMADDFGSEEVELISSMGLTEGMTTNILCINTPTGASVSGAGGKKVNSAMNTQVLQQLQAMDYVEVIPLTLDDSDVKQVSGRIKTNLVFQEKPEESSDEWQDQGWWLIIPLMIIFLLWFRKGWVIYGLILMIFTSCGQVERFDDLWFTRDYQGQRLAKDGKYEEAAARYEDPLLKGNAYFKAGDFNAAINAYTEDSSALGKYNLGLAYFQEGQLDEALRAFGLAAKLDPSMEEAVQQGEGLSKMLANTDKMSTDSAEDPPGDESGQDNTVENNDMEDLGGGGQEATEEDMKKERKSETVNSDIHKAEELDEVPEDIGVEKQSMATKVMMRKVDDDPALFLKRKFEFQVKSSQTKNLQDEKN